jgi:hypothetical protein
MPNVFYFDKAKVKSNALNYHDWVVFFLEPKLAARTGALFAPGNAAAAGGATLRPGVEGLSRLFEPQVNGWVRGEKHKFGSPTDIQAEVLIPGPIPLDAVRGIFLPSLDHVDQERGRLEQLGGTPDIFEWFACPPLFERESVRRAVQRGVALTAERWKDLEANGDDIEG